MSLQTYSDLVDLMIYSDRGGDSMVESREIRVAVSRAYRNLMTRRDWKFMLRDWRLAFDEPYETGTVSYNTTTRALTLAGGTWPSWARYGRVIIDDVISTVASRDSGSVLTLDEHLNPKETKTGESYQLIRTDYQLPVGYKNAYAPVTEDQWDLCYLPLADFMQQERVWNQQGSPWYWTLMADPHQTGRMIMRISGYPDEVETLDLIVQGMGRELLLSGYESKSFTGTVACATATQAVTGTDTAFDQSMVGAVLRFSGSSAEPTGVGGTNPYAEQHEIQSVTGATNLTLKTPVVAALGYSGVGFRVSDPLDLAEPMQEVFDIECMRNLATIRKDWKTVGALNEQYRIAMISCMESERGYRGPMSQGTTYVDWTQLGIQRAGIEQV